jgi:hypothetical protein
MDESCMDEGMRKLILFKIQQMDQFGYFPANHVGYIYIHMSNYLS